jgi:hypothetical protein
MVIKIVKTNPKLVFPQANDIYKVIKFVDDLTNNNHQKALKRISTIIVDRQKSYYKSAAKFLGLIDKLRPTELGRAILNSEKTEMMLSIANLILNQEIFYKYYLNKDISQVIDTLKTTYNMNDTTAKRRSSTVKAWINWCNIIIEENLQQIEVEIN